MSEDLADQLGIDGLTDMVQVDRGGFSTVYRANQPAFSRTVAVKVLSNANLDQEAKERFERECQTMGSLSEHPNIVTVYGAGFTSSGRPYLMMSYLQSGSLQDTLNRDGTIPWQKASLYGVHLAGALETAHRANIVHRDIKPGNVLMSAFGEAQLTDFGIARVAGGHETGKGVVAASVTHAPPEVLDGQRPTHAADVYSLGSTLFEFLNGKPCFEMDDMGLVPLLRRILNDPVTDLRPMGVPDEICLVIEKAMSKDPALRQQSALEFGRELRLARRKLGLDPGKLTVPAADELDEGDEISFVADTVDVAAVTRRATLIGVGVAVIIVLIGAFFVSRSATDNFGQGFAAVTTTEPGTIVKVAGYTQVMETNFVEGCAKNPQVPRLYCRCIYQGISSSIPYEEFKVIDAELRKGADMKGTAVQGVIEQCDKDFTTATTAPPPS
jgi:tRNA A-37 threonylcarbamoyl transferase component Bud32